MPLKPFALTFLLFISAQSAAQTFNQTFTGNWGWTSWTFDFNTDGTFIRTSAGHFGSPVYSGTYRIHNDTLEILKGYEKTSGTVNRYYLLEGDSIIIDLSLWYDYKLDSLNKNYGSIKRKKVSAVMKNGSGAVTDTLVRFVADRYAPWGPDLAELATHFGFPSNFRPGTQMQRAAWQPVDSVYLRRHKYDTEGRLVKYIYGDMIPGTPAASMNIQYKAGSDEIEKVIDSRDRSSYEVYYNDEKQISKVIYFTSGHKMMRALVILEVEVK